MEKCYLQNYSRKGLHLKIIFYVICEKSSQTFTKYAMYFLVCSEYLGYFIVFFFSSIIHYPVVGAPLLILPLFFFIYICKGLCKEKKFKKSEITMDVGWWVQMLLGNYFFGKSSQNSFKPVLIFWSSIPCVFCLYIHC